MKFPIFNKTVLLSFLSIGFSLCLVLIGVFFNSCALNYGSAFNSKVKVWVSPYGEGDELRSSEPIIFTGGATLVCRPSAPDPKKIREFLEKHALLEDENSPIFDLYGIDPNEEGTAEGNQGSVQSAALRGPTKVALAENWLKLGLHIANANENVYLVVTGISFTAQARQGNQIFNHSGNIPVSYCDNPYQALYIVPPRTRVEYKPYSSNFLENLTIYIDSFKIIDTTKDAPAQQGGVGGAATAAGASNAAQGASGSGSQGCGISIPRYTVKMILTGHFITQKGTQVSGFIHRVIFFTEPSFIGC